MIGRGVVMTSWGALLATLACIGALGGCRAAELGEFRSNDGGFLVRLPRTPAITTQTDRGVTTTLHRVAEGNGAFLVSFADFPIPCLISEERRQGALDAFRDGAIRSVGGTLTNSARVTLEGGYPGREVEADVPTANGVLRGRFYLVNRRFYTVMVVGRRSWADSVRTRTFLDSFGLVDGPPPCVDSPSPTGQE